MQVECPVVPGAEAPPIGSDELPEVLMLFRASTLKMIRFQLAMERQDRRVALEAVDDLVALDRRLRDYIASSGADEQLLFRQGLDHERAMLNQEKLTLAAEVLRRPQAEVSEPQPPEVQQDSSASDDWVLAEEYSDRPRRWLFAIPVLASGVAAGVYFTGISDARAWLAATGLG